MSITGRMMHPERYPADDHKGQAVIIALFVMECATLSVGVFLHYDYGQRRLRLFNQFWTSVSLYVGFILAGAYFSIVAGTKAELLGWFFLASLIMATVQSIAIHFRGNEGRYIFSYYDGTPRLRALLPFLKEYQIKRYVEPVLIFVLGWIVLAVGNAPLGGWLCFAALSQAALNERIRALSQNRVLDVKDEELFGQWLNDEARHDKEGSEANGIETWGITYARPEDLPEAVARSAEQWETKAPEEPKAKKPAPAPAPELEAEPHEDIFSRLSSDMRSLLDRFNDDTSSPRERQRNDEPNEPETERTEQTQSSVALPEAVACSAERRDTNLASASGANGKRPVGRPRKYVNDSASV